MLIFIGIGSLVQMYKVTNRVYKPVEMGKLAKENFFMADAVHNKISKNNIAFLKMQYKAINIAKDNHKEIGRIYYANYYTFTVILALAIILGGIMLIIIANKGWLAGG